MSQPTLNSSFSGISFAGMNRGRLSYPSLRASGDNYSNFRIDEERLSAPNVHSSGLPVRPDVTHVLRRDPPHRRERLSQPTLVPGDYYPGRGHQRLSQPCLSSGGKELQTILNSPVKHKRFSSPAKLPQRDRLHQLDFGTTRVRKPRELQSVDLAKFNRDRFSIPELETANDLKLIAGIPKQRYSLDSSLNEPKRRSRLLPIASSPISENLVKSDQLQEGKKAADGLESVLVTGTTPLLSSIESVLDPVPPLTIPTSRIGNNQRMSVPEISTSSLRRLLDPPGKQRHSITGNLKQCILPVMKKTKKAIKTGIEVPKDDDEPMIKNIQRHYAYTYENSNEACSFLSKDTMSVIPRKKFLESNFDKNEQVITTVIESEIPMILASPKKWNKGMAYGNETPKWMRKYLNLENENPKIEKKNNCQHMSRRKAWQNSNRDSINSEDFEKEIAKKNTNAIERRDEKKIKESKDTRVQIESRHFKDKYQISENPNPLETDICKLYGLDYEDTDSDESTSI